MKKSTKGISARLIRQKMKEQDKFMSQALTDWHMDNPDEPEVSNVIIRALLRRSTHKPFASTDEVVSEIKRFLELEKEVKKRIRFLTPAEEKEIFTSNL